MNDVLLDAYIALRLDNGDARLYPVTRASPNSVRHMASNTG
jgi:hypothetical protein